MQPGQFWEMTVVEWFWIADAKAKQIEAERAALDPYYMPERDWEELRREHREKMKRLKSNG